METQRLSFYERNRLFISASEQRKIKNFRIILGGAGIGSVIAECALRMGFENICLVDGDVVETSNLNRQNYIFSDIQKSKAKAVCERLKSINPKAKIKFINKYITEENLSDFQLEKYDIAINALDFSSNIPFIFDKVCLENNIPILHPYNFGWAGCVFVVNENSLQLGSLQTEPHRYEVNFATYVSNYFRNWNERKAWLEKIVKAIANEKPVLSPPQLSVGAWIVAGMCTNLLFSLATNKPVKTFPEFYFCSVNDL